MKKPTKIIQRLARQISVTFPSIFLFSSLILASEGARIPLVAKDFSHTSPQEETAQTLQLEKIRVRAKSIEKESLSKAIQERMDWFIQRAEVALRTKDLESARRSVRQALVLDPHQRRALALLAEIAQATQDRSSRPSFSLFKEEVPYLSESERKKMIASFIRRGHSLLEKQLYDEAVAEFESVFVLDPLNPEASRKIDNAKKRFIHEKRKQWEDKAVQYDEDFSDKLEYSLATVERLIQGKDFMEAKVLLNRMAFVDPNNKRVRKWMERVQKLEDKESRGKAR